jgi:hypothetical protein
MQIMVDRLLRRYRTEGFVTSDTAFSTPSTKWRLTSNGKQQLEKLAADLKNGMILVYERTRKARTRQPTFKDCSECGNEFEVPRRHPNQDHCSGSCAAKASARRFWANAQPIAACQVDTPVTDKEDS